jgi:hypothetical protein
MNPRLIVEPAVPFDAIDRQLAELGWIRQPSTSMTAPLVPGEPEFAAWRRRDQRASYSFNPVVRLRSLGFSGDQAASAVTEAARRLPALDLAAIRALLTGATTQDLLLGIFAARELEAVLALDAVAALREHTDHHVAAAAERATAELSSRLIQSGTARLSAEQVQRPGYSPIFPRLGDAHQRRQLLRVMLADAQRGDGMLTLLRTALEDDDWEVRVGAVIAAGRLNARELWAEVRRAELPATSRHGPDRHDQSVLRAARRLTLDLLQHGRVRSDSTAQEHLRRCVIGERPLAYDRIFLLVHALTQPHDHGCPPRHLPQGVVADGDRFAAAAGNVELCWIDAVPHWLGSGEPDEPPVRRIEPASGFFISRLPLGEPATWADARAQVSAIAKQTGAAARFPAPDEWECAARGSDGRRYPWGNGFERDAEDVPSPWGVCSVAAIDGDWTIGGLEACGDRRDLRVTARRRVQPTDLLRVRLVIPV